MFYSRGLALYFLAIYLVIGGVAGVAVAFGAAAIARRRLNVRQYLVMAGLGVLGSGLGICALMVMPSQPKATGLLAAALGAEPHWSDVFSLVGAVVAALTGCLILLARESRAKRA